MKLSQFSTLAQYLNKIIILFNLTSPTYTQSHHYQFSTVVQYLNKIIILFNLISPT